MDAIKKENNNTLPGLPSAYKPSSRMTAKSDHSKLLKYLNAKMTKLFPRIGELSLKKGIPSHEISKPIEELLPQDKGLSSEDGILSKAVNEPYLAEIEELASETEELSSKIGIQSQEEDKLSSMMTEEMSPEGDDLCEERSTATTTQPSTSQDEERKVCANTRGVTKYAFLLKQGVQLTDVAEELSDEKMNSLWEDIFKPLDFYSILHERNKEVSLSKIETNMQNLFM